MGFIYCMFLIFVLHVATIKTSLTAITTLGIFNMYITSDIHVNDKFTV